MFKKILVPVDFSAQCRKAYESAIELGRLTDAEIVLMHVGAIPTTPEHLDPSMSEVERMYENILKTRMNSARKVMHDWLQEFDGQSIEVSSVVTEGVPHERIIEVADELGADLIVMGTHGRTGLSHFFVGSTAERVVRGANVPVLTMRGETGK